MAWIRHLESDDREVGPMRNKVTIVGAGNVGAATAQLIVQSGLADVVLVDVVEGLAEGT
jgi:malate dehydrogenase